MVEYCTKINEHISKITERYIKMAYSKHKMIEYRGDGGLGAATRGIGGWSMRGRRGARVGGARTSAGLVAHEVDWIGPLVGWFR
jgi:hypothetical protein